VIQDKKIHITVSNTKSKLKSAINLICHSERSEESLAQTLQPQNIIVLN